MPETQIQRLSTGDAALGQSLFAMMASVFEEPYGDPSSAYVERLLRRDDFWALAAIEDQSPIGGLTAFTLPLSRAEYSELLIYDIAVLPNHQRRGVGRRLVQSLRKLAASEGIATLWVPAADEDTHALDFYRRIGGTPNPVTIFTFERD